MNKKYKNLISDTFVFALGTLGSKIILFLLVPLYTNYLSKAEYGTADLITTFSQLIIPVASLAINSAVIRFALKKDEKPENVILAAFSVFGFTLIISGLSLPALSLYKAIAPWRLYLFIYVILATISETEKAYLKAKNRNKAYAVISVFQTLVLATTNLILLKYLNAGVDGYLFSNLLAVGVTAILSYFAASIFKDLKKAKFDFQLLKRMVQYSSPLILNNMSWWVIHSSDKIMIERMIDASELGLYTAATKIPSLINVIISIFNQAWGLSSIREIESDNDTGFISSVFSIYSTLTIGAGIFFTSIIRPFMRVYVGSEFQSAWQYTPLLLTAAVFYAISAYYGSLYSAIQHTVNSMYTTILCAVVNVVVNFCLIGRIGVFGAVIGTVSSYFVISIVRMIDMKRYLKINIDYTRFVLNVIVLIIHSILVSLNWHISIVSIVACTMFICINVNSIKKIIIMTTQKLKR